jgi:hypothetical protein
MANEEVTISVSKEFHEHYRIITQRRDDILDDPEETSDTVVKMLNATTAILRDMEKIQASLYNSENFARLQQVIVNVLKECSPELQEKVLKAFKKRLESA